MDGARRIRLVLPFHLRTLARVEEEFTLDIPPSLPPANHAPTTPDAPVTQRMVLDALEARFPVLAGTIRDHGTKKRRPFIRFFACQMDLSHESPDAPLPAAVAEGKEPYLIVGAIAGG